MQNFDGIFTVAFIALCVISIIETIGLIYILIKYRLVKKPVRKEVNINERPKGSGKGRP
jgi:uncharacterized membrane protein